MQDGIKAARWRPRGQHLLTVTVVLDVFEPFGFVAVKVYSVVVTGCTVTLTPLIAPMPLMLRLVAPDTSQINVLDPPGAMMFGSALNKLMVGGPALVMRGRNRGYPSKGGVGGGPVLLT
jgi:hypothetical protein